jgi:divalent anion:Na+ symporter, DASS family
LTPQLQLTASRSLARWTIVLIPALLLYFVPIPAFTPAQQHLLAVFVGTIVALVAQPVPMGVSVVIAMVVLAFARILPGPKILSGFSNQTVWLIFSAFLFARAVTTTGFGLRIAYSLIRRFGSSPLSIGYCVAASDVALAPFVPSDTARGGGVIFPITRSLAQAFGSEPGPTAERIGSYLMLVGFHATYTASAMFLTGMVANPLIADFARSIGHVDLTWMRWAIGSSVPGFITLLLMPIVLLRFAPPQVRDMAPARAYASEQLRSMGPMKRGERILVVILVAVMAGWVSSPWHGIPNAFVALAGLTSILLLRVLTWDDLLSEKKAWDALIWFAPLLMMADALNEAGVIGILSKAVFGHMSGWSWGLALVVLIAGYVYIHYTFASMTAQVTALYPGFLAAALAAGVPPLLAALPLAYFSNLNAGITHYGTGSAPIYFGAGYVGQGTWWKLGFIISVMNLAIWIGVGLPWWKLVGFW